MVEFHKQKRMKYVEGTKLKYVPFCQLKLKTIFGDYFFQGLPVSKNMKQNEFLTELFPTYELNLIITLKKLYLYKYIFPATTRLEIIHYLMF